jgi:hypothetical protein
MRCIPVQDYRFSSVQVQVVVLTEWTPTTGLDDPGTIATPIAQVDETTVIYSRIHRCHAVSLVLREITVFVEPLIATTEETATFELP